MEVPVKQLSAAAAQSESIHYYLQYTLFEKVMILYLKLTLKKKKLDFLVPRKCSFVGKFLAMKTDQPRVINRSNERDVQIKLDESHKRMSKFTGIS